MKKILTIILIFFSNSAAYAVTVSSVSNAAVHGGTLTITGSDFGSKSPAAPLLWDDGENKTIDSDAAVNAVYSDVWPSTLAAPITTHRTRYRAIPHEGTTGPHSYSTKYLSGGHYQRAGNSPAYIGGVGCAEEEQYLNVAVTADNGSAADHWYASFYYRLNPSWNTSGIEGYNNHKVTTVQSGSEAYTPGGDFQYIVYEADNSPALEAGDNCTIETGSVDLANPRIGWIKWEEIVDNGGSREIIVNNVSDGQNLTTNLTGIRSFTVGGYYRFVTTGGSLADNCDYRGADPNVNLNFRYFDDIYIDTTYARVMLCNHATYASATICEPQIPTVWDSGGGSITVTVNRGALSTGANYLFVFDSTNAANATGFEVNIVDGVKAVQGGVTLTGSGVSLR